jgi:hypothetical protein
LVNSLLRFLKFLKTISLSGSFFKNKSKVFSLLIRCSGKVDDVSIGFGLLLWNTLSGSCRCYFFPPA